MPGHTGPVGGLCPISTYTCSIRPTLLISGSSRNPKRPEKIFKRVYCGPITTDYEHIIARRLVKHVKQRTILHTILRARLLIGTARLESVGIDVEPVEQALSSRNGV